MDIGAWILQIVLAAAFVAAGGAKRAEPMADTNVKLIGAIEVLGVLALVVAVLRFAS